MPCESGTLSYRGPAGRVAREPANPPASALRKPTDEGRPEDDRTLQWVRKTIRPSHFRQVRKNHATKKPPTGPAFFSESSWSSDRDLGRRGLDGLSSRRDEQHKNRCEALPGREGDRGLSHRGAGPTHGHGQPALDQPYRGRREGRPHGSDGGRRRL